MGTDIHGFLESRWRSNQSWFRECEIEDSRNYRVFAVLAGVPTHAAIEPIAQPRGLPDDRTKGHGEDAEWEYGDHSWSWLTLDEIANWSDWDRDLQEQGWIDRDQYVEWQKEGGGTPSRWSGGISGHSIVHADDANGFFPDGWTHISVSWRRPLREACGLFLAWLNYAQVKTGGREARIVFGFDS